MTKEGLLVFLLMIGFGVGIAAYYDSSMPKPYHANPNFRTVPNATAEPAKAKLPAPKAKPKTAKAKPEIRRGTAYSGSGQTTRCHDPEGWDRGNCNPNFVTPGIQYHDRY